MKIVSNKQMKEILDRLDKIDSRLDALDVRMDALDSRMDRLETNLTEFKHKTEVKLAEISSTGALCKTQFECMSIIVSFLMAVILLGGGTYLVNMNDRLTNDYKSLQEKVETNRS